MIKFGSKGKSSVITLILLLIAAVIAFLPKGQDGKFDTVAGDAPLSVHYINVGQGDSIFVRLPNGETMLIDAGENDQGAVVCRYLTSLGVEKIDYLVGTHPHSDHIGGLDTVIMSFDVGVVYLPDATSTSKTFEDVLDAIRKKELKTYQAKAGVSIVSNEDKSISVSVLSPVSNSYEGLNNASIVISLRYMDTSFLFTGDAEYTVEKELWDTIAHHDVLKVGHHGSNTSSTAKFLERVSPQYAVIPVGCDNAYGHPHDEVLGRLSRFGCKIYRTDTQGTVVALSDGKTIQFQTER